MGTEEIIQIEDFVQAFLEVLNVSDEAFNAMRDEIIENVKLSFHNSATMHSLEEQITQLRVNNVPIATVEKQINEGVEAFNTLCENLKKTYTAKSKQSFLDMLKSEFASLQLEFLDMYKKEKVIVKAQLLHKNAKIPNYTNIGDQGADLYAVEDITIAPHTYGNLVKLGIAFAIPTGWALGIRPRSGMSKKTTLRLSNCYGTIDTSYKDEIGVLFDNIGDEPYTIHAGDRIAQLILEKNYNAEFEVVDNVKDYGSDRGGGFGHTGA